MDSVRLLAWYYGATVLFVILDLGFGLNIRAAFLEPWPAARLAYYGFCFCCLGAILWRPSWSTAVGTLESLIVVVALILGMAVRVLVPTDAIFDENAPIVTTREIVNFLIAGFAAYYAWIQGIKQLKSR